MSSVITFINNLDEESGKTMSLVAIATYMAINYNEKILVISTTNKEDKIKSCYFEEQQVKKLRLGLFGDKTSTIDTESGIEGIAKMVRSNKLTPEVITNYTRVVFKDRLEIILGYQPKEEKQADIDVTEIDEEYPNLISIAKMYYDRILVDLDNNLSEELRQRIVDHSDLVIVNTSQNLNSIKKLKTKKENSPLLQSSKTLILVGRYDKFSTYNAKNITRFLGEKNQVLTIPYNTLLFEASNEAGVPDLFLRLKRISDIDDRNAIFMQEVKRATENIIYRLQELQAIL
ncbi:putative uncharacterized protein [Clostridium sp. CAG:389]|nr:putative uncharacterized protein [Clostridium sp. CAG:389]